MCLDLTMKTYTPDAHEIETIAPTARNPYATVAVRWFGRGATFFYPWVNYPCYPEISLINDWQRPEKLHFKGFGKQVFFKAHCMSNAEIDRHNTQNYHISARAKSFSTEPNLVPRLERIADEVQTITNLGYLYPPK